jgi:CDP-diglyceride synthetase
VKTVVDATYRWSVASRFFAAVAGGYALVLMLQVAFVAVLPTEYYKALLFSSQTGYLYWTGIIVWCFATRTARRAWLGLAIVAAPLALIDAWYLMHRGVA